MSRGLWAVVLVASLAHADGRPPPRGHAERASGAGFLAALRAPERERLQREGLVVREQKSSSDGGPVMLRAVVLFRRPSQEAFELLTRPSDQATYLPHVQVSRRVGERSAEGERDDFVVSMLVTLEYRVQHWFYPEELRSEWSLDPSGGTAFTELSGSWQLYAVDETLTVGEYSTHLESRNGFLNVVRSLGERGGLAEALRALKLHVEGAKL